MGPPGAQPPQHSAYPEPPTAGLGWPPAPSLTDLAGPAWGPASTLHPPPSQDGLDSGSRARLGGGPAALARRQGEGAACPEAPGRAHPPVQTLTLQTSPWC